MKQLFYLPKAAIPFSEGLSFNDGDHLFLARLKETSQKEKSDSEPEGYTETNVALLLKDTPEEKEDEVTNAPEYVFTKIDDGFEIQDGDNLYVISDKYIRLLKFERGFKYANDDELGLVRRACKKWWSALGRK